MISCANLSPDDLVLKKMLYLYITHYATSVPDMALLAINQVGREGGGGVYLYITHYATSVPDMALLAINQVGREGGE